MRPKGVGRWPVGRFRRNRRLPASCGRATYPQHSVRNLRIELRLKTENLQAESEIGEVRHAEQSARRAFLSGVSLRAFGDAFHETLD